jgi:hypothetical protein
MNKSLVGLAVILSVSLITIVSCSDKNSTEACLHEASMNLDSGNYDAVLASTCAGAMDKGAAYFGKAGYSVTSVVNSFVDAGATGSGSTQSDLNIYMTALVKSVSGASLDNLDKARDAYATVALGTDNYKPAQFNISIVLALKTLSLIRTVIPGDLVNPDGTLNKTCDVNINGVPDSADATACALLAASAINTGATPTCSGALVTRSTPTDISIYTDAALTTQVSGTYSGLTIRFTGSLTTGCTTTTYNRLLYKNATGQYFAATTTSDLCYQPSSIQWPCPVTGVNQDLVTSIDNSINSAISSLNSAITATNTDVQNAINDIKSQACSSPCAAVCGVPATCPLSCQAGATIYCSSEDLSNYITTNLN